ncbi:hypothetical protein DRJ16_03705 [Candidatus Woesearchaeota archaeon]|nr:MAG: hypothetical protein DRJ16_03705 [Candidatus Woesearchaeota archaeon]
MKKAKKDATMQDTVYIKTFGCALNRADSERMAYLLKNAGFRLVDSPEKARLVIVNTCTVKNLAEKKAIKYVKQLEELNKKIIVAGCIPKANPSLFLGYSQIGPDQIHQIVSAVEETLEGNIIEYLVDEQINKLKIPSLRFNPVIGIVPIASGCTGNCSYCHVKLARGNLYSYPAEDIISTIKRELSTGAKEIWLTSQDTGCYGLDKNSSLPELLKEITAIDGDFFIRLGMANPNHVLNYLNELIEIFKNPKMFKFLHIPVQSGCDRILYLMNRKYTAEDFKKIVFAFRKEIPNITIATDIICGFPSETEEEFNHTIELIKETKPDVLNISRFWPRPKTEAAKMPNQIHGSETKKRSSFLTALHTNIARMQNEKWIDWQGKALIDEIGKNNSLIGRNFAYKPIVIKNHKESDPADFLGKFIKVKITSVTPYDLRGKILTSSF